VSTSAVGFWEYGKAKPEGHNKEALVALRKLGKREVRKILEEKAEGRKKVARKPGKPRRKRG
jgi:hypothetical protein